MARVCLGCSRFFVFDARITAIDLPGVDTVLGMAAVSLVFTMFAVGGFAHAFNIVDGLNGLAGLVAMLILSAIAWVAGEAGDALIRDASLLLAFAVAGFLVWNTPRARLFLGDGGSYLLGFLIAELAVLLVHRNVQVSPWFALVALGYPVCETLFSGYRRVVYRNASPMKADGLHLHTLVYKRLFRRKGRDTDVRNALAALCVLPLAVITVLAAALFWTNPWALQAAAIAFVCLYLVCYRSLVRFRLPRWVASLRKGARGEGARFAVPGPKRPIVIRDR
ncbi:MAG: glycosyltransferase [Burkholderiales bacterium]|nr:glycosyltransferase [Burkholderiales bacterium]